MTILIYFRGAPPDLRALGIRRWIEHAAAIVRGYYGVFPVRILRVLVVTVEGDRMLPAERISSRRYRHWVQYRTHPSTFNWARRGVKESPRPPPRLAPHFVERLQ